MLSISSWNGPKLPSPMVKARYRTLSSAGAMDDCLSWMRPYAARKNLENGIYK